MGMKYVRGFDRFIRSRYQFKNGGIIGCEVGIREGNHLKQLLKIPSVKKIYAVDVDLSLLKLSDNRIVKLEMNSIDAIDYIDEFLDFVYLDGNHSYSNVKLELEKYSEISSIVGGHDFSPRHPSVAKAVIEFAEKQGKVIGCGKDNDWWLY